MKELNMKELLNKLDENTQLEAAGNANFTSAFTIMDEEGKLLSKRVDAGDDPTTLNLSQVKMWARPATAQKQLKRLQELENHKGWLFYGQEFPSKWRVVEITAQVIGKG